MAGPETRQVMNTPHVTEAPAKVEIPSSLPDEVRSDLQWALRSLNDAHASLDYGLDGLVEIDGARADKLNELLVDVEFAVAELEDILRGLDKREAAGASG
jgi:hypothetical protein